jgi:ribonuclease BN (tRNA processing enzyme)
VFITDNELGHRHRGGQTFDEYAEFANNADLFFHDAEYTPEQYKVTKTWGHSTYIDALNVALAARVKKFGLFHHNQDRSDADQDVIVQKCLEIIKKEKNNMECFALTQTTELTL